MRERSGRCSLNSEALTEGKLELTQTSIAVGSVWRPGQEGGHARDLRYGTVSRQLLAELLETR